MKKHQIILGLVGVILVTITKIISGIFSWITDNIITIGIIFSIPFAAILVYQLYANWFFSSKRFKNIKDSISDHIKNCNELNCYINELKSSFVDYKSRDFGKSNLIDQSNYNFKRSEWNKKKVSHNVHNCSLSVLKNADNQPLKYLCKYFDIDKNEKTLSNFEQILNDFTSVEEGKNLLQNEKESILAGISKSIPGFILYFSRNRLIKELGFESVDISNSYIPTFTFQYVSAGGNSTAKCDIKLDIENLNNLINYLNDTIKWRKSFAGQRALMTSKLRQIIKERDNFKCCNCKLGVYDEPNLLLEIDHIKPISKGGLTTEENLQTLCWRCNRAKGSKILI